MYYFKPDATSFSSNTTENCVRYENDADQLSPTQEVQRWIASGMSDADLWSLLGTACVDPARPLADRQTFQFIKDRMAQ